MLQLDGNISLDNSLLECSLNLDSIPVIINHRPEQIAAEFRGPNLKNLKVLKRNNKLLEASYLPVVVNLNPCSLYNKKEEFCTLIEQVDVGICCVSETWDRSHSENGVLISDLIDIDGYRWIKSVNQRNRRGGKPAILASESNYHITDLNPDVITVPSDVEAAWAHVH